MKMIDVGEKEKTERIAVATAFLSMKPETVKLLRSGKIEKGDPIEAARLAAVMAAKKTPDLIPLCHPIALTSVRCRIEIQAKGVAISVEVKTKDRTGVEMEALTAASTAALTIYDMLKSVDRGMRVERLQLEAKSGGRSGDWFRTNGRRSRA